MARTDDDDFGVLEWEGSIGKWQGNARLPDGSLVRVLIEPNDDRSISSRCRLKFRAVPGQLEQWKRKVSADLLSTYNDLWNVDEAEPIPISDEEFRSRIFLEALSLRADGSLDVWFGTNDLFTGHAIRIPVGPDGDMPHKAGVEG